MQPTLSIRTLASNEGGAMLGMFGTAFGGSNTYTASTRMTDIWSDCLQLTRYSQSRRLRAGM